MAVLAAAQLLDELMGRHRNVAPNEKVKATNWEDIEYCKFFMVKFCPHDLFVNTRADLGPCAKTHDEEARKLFQDAKKTHYRKLQYMEDFVRFCSSMISEVDRKIIKGKQRLALSGKSVLSATNPVQAEKNQEKIGILNERINELEKEAEQAGTDGNVEQAQGLMKLCDQLKEERDVLKRYTEIGHLNATAQLAVEQEKQMEVCEVCGAFLIVGDAQQRIDDHLMGKQHMGYMRLKKAVDDISAIVKDVKDGPKREKDDRKDKERERDREKRREREKEKEIEKEKERSRSEQRDKDKEKEREKERERKEKEKEREKKRIEEREKKDRERDRERDKEKDRGKGGETELVRESKLRDRERERVRERDRDRRHRSDRDDRHRHHHHRHRR